MFVGWLWQALGVESAASAEVPLGREVLLSTAPQPLAQVSVSSQTGLCPHRNPQPNLALPQQPTPLCPSVPAETSERGLSGPSGLSRRAPSPRRARPPTQPPHCASTAGWSKDDIRAPRWHAWPNQSWINGSCTSAATITTTILSSLSGFNHLPNVLILLIPPQTRSAPLLKRLRTALSPRVLTAASSVASWAQLQHSLTYLPSNAISEDKHLLILVHCF